MPDYYTTMLKQECEAMLKALSLGDPAVIDYILKRLRRAVDEAQLYRGGR